MRLATSAFISREAVSCDTLHIFAHLEEVKLPSKPSNSMLTIFLWFTERLSAPCSRQNSALERMSDAVAVQRLAFNCGGIDDLARNRLADGLTLDVKAKRGKPAEEFAERKGVF